MKDTLLSEWSVNPCWWCTEMLKWRSDHRASFSWHIMLIFEGAADEPTCVTNHQVSALSGRFTVKLTMVFILPGMQCFGQKQVEFHRAVVSRVFPIRTTSRQVICPANQSNVDLHKISLKIKDYLRANSWSLRTEEFYGRCITWTFSFKNVNISAEYYKS